VSASGLCGRKDHHHARALTPSLRLPSLITPSFVAKALEYKQMSDKLHSTVGLKVAFRLNANDLIHEATVHRVKHVSRALGLLDRVVLGE